MIDTDSKHTGVKTDLDMNKYFIPKVGNLMLDECEQVCVFVFEMPLFSQATMNVKGSVLHLFKQQVETM